MTNKNKKRLKNLGVRIVYLFGSYAEGTDHTISDVDIGVVFRDIDQINNNINSVYLELYDILTEQYKDRRVDIVFLQRAGIELCFDVIRHGRILYQNSAEDRLNYEESVFRRYIDFKPLLNQFDHAVLERIENG
ncbi:nucleotidyltransferase domain-containing protein [bacterium]|nr:nucleotidyltransferase domain-containing protein [bacterium]